MKMTLFLTALLSAVLLDASYATTKLPGAETEWQVIDRAVAVVNNRPILESTLNRRFARVRRHKTIANNRLAFEKSRLLDAMIDEQLVVQKAADDSIIVSDEKINGNVEKIMERMKIGTLDDFKKRVVAREGISWEEYREEMRVQLIKEQVMSISIGISPPSEKDATDWYNKNKDKLGFQVNIKHILLRPRNDSMAEEKRINELAKEIAARAQAGESFENLARRYSQDPVSAGKGGDLSWVLLAELDPYFASQVYQMGRIGQVSGPIRSSYGYHVVKFFGRRVTPFDAVRDRILQLLYHQNLDMQFSRWIAQRRRESEVKIYLQEYVKVPGR